MKVNKDKYHVGLVSWVLWAWSTAALAAPVELEFAKGVVAFSRSDFVTAEKHLQAVLEQQPKNSQAAYYLGQAVMHLGEAERAVELFKWVIRLRPTDPAVRLDLALALIKANQFVQAEQELESAAQKLKERASLHYYLGYCRYRMGHLRGALAPLKRAKSQDQGFGAAAGYYLGLIHAQLGQQEEATRYFRQVAASEGATEISTLARQNLAFLAEEGEVKIARRWGAFASTGIGYDTNVTLDTTDPSNAKSAQAFVSIGGFYVPINKKRDILQIALSIFRSFNSTEHTQSYNLTDVSTDLRWRHQFGAGHRLELGYLFDLDMLDGPEQLNMDGFGIYMHGHTGLGRFRIHEGRRTNTVLEYRFRALFFHNELNFRDYFGHEGLVRQDVWFAANRARLSIIAGVLWEDARDSSYDLRGPFGELEFRFKLMDDLSIWGQGGWHGEDHFKTERLDNLWMGASGLTWSIWTHIHLGMSYRYLKSHSSIEYYDYDRHLVYLAVMGNL